MNTIRDWGTAAFFVATSGVMIPCAVASEESNGAVIVEWNQLLQQTYTGPPIGQARDYAMLHIAMADAVVALHKRYQPFHAQVSAPSGASEEAAAAQAGHDVLVALLPAAQAAADTTLAKQLAQIPPGRRSLGIQAGASAAAQILAWRQNDGYASANPQP